LITTLTPKAVLPKHQQLEAGRLYYILPNSKLLVQQQEDDDSEDQQPQPNSIFDRKKPMIMQTRGSASSAARESMVLPFEIKLHSKKQQVPGFAQVTVRGQDVATRLVFTAAEDPGLAGRRHVEDEDQLPVAHMISYSTPDLRSMYPAGAAVLVGRTVHVLLPEAIHGNPDWKPSARSAHTPGEGFKN
jgi:hypothetical protein